MRTANEIVSDEKTMMDEAEESRATRHSPVAGMSKGTHREIQGIGSNASNGPEPELGGAVRPGCNTTSVESERNRNMSMIAEREMEHIDRERIEVKGSRITLEGKPARIAAQVKKGGEVLKLRDDDGRPVWAGWRRSYGQ
jgi:hypothetical protein